MIRSAIRYIMHRTYRPFLIWYLSKERKFTYNNVEIKVWPGVFHPGFFYSSTFLLDYLTEQVSLTGKSFLELGCGSALISIAAAKQGAIVTASDISSKAVENAAFNAHLNNVDIEIIKSDLFDNIKRETFDIIAVNPPYYKGSVSKEEDYAWYSGDAYQYFHKLFGSLCSYMHDQTKVYMVLSNDCEWEQFEQIAQKASFQWDLKSEAKMFLERNYIWQIKFKSK